MESHFELSTVRFGDPNRLSLVLLHRSNTLITQNDRFTSIVLLLPIRTGQVLILDLDFLFTPLRVFNMTLARESRHDHLALIFLFSFSFLSFFPFLAPFFF